LEFGLLEQRNNRPVSATIKRVAYSNKNDTTRALVPSFFLVSAVQFKLGLQGTINQSTKNTRPKIAHKVENV
jgi:hypothetical protein